MDVNIDDLLDQYLSITSYQNLFSQLKTLVMLGHHTLTHISVSCQEGSYKSGDMKLCQTCDAGKEPNSDKTACGEIISLWAMSSSTYSPDQFYHQFNRQNSGTISGIVL